MDYFGKVIAVDTSLFIHKSLHSKSDSGAVQGIFNLLSILRKFKIIAVWVFDGKPDTNKLSIIEGRKLKQSAHAKLEEIEDQGKETLEDQGQKIKQETSNEVSEINEEMIKTQYTKYHMNKDKVDKIKQLLDILGCPYIHNNEYEADFVCAELVKSGFAYACLSNDFDLLAYGCPRILRDFNIRDQTVQEYKLNDVYKVLQVNETQFIDFVLLLGTDICPKLKGYTSDYKLELIQTHGNINNALEYINILSEFNSREATPSISTPIEFYNNIRRVYEISSIVGDIDFTKGIIHISNCYLMSNIIKKKYGIYSSSELIKMQMHNNSKERIECVKRNARYNRPSFTLSLGYKNTLNYLISCCPKLKQFIIEDKLDYIIYL